MKVIGVTGGIGCGKSTVIEIMKEHYASYILSTDVIAMKLMEQGNVCYEKIVEYFGDTILRVDGKIDRKKLSNLVFKSERELLKLNSFTHPYVREYVLNQISEQKKKHEDIYDYILVETALPYEAHLKEYCDEIWYVTSSLEIRRDRLMNARGYSFEKINDIFNKQLSDDAYQQFANHVILNNSSTDDVKEQIQVILRS